MAEEQSKEELAWEVDVSEAKELIDAADDVVLLDCREQSEFELVHLPNSLLIPTSRFEEGLSVLQSCRESRILVLCHHGVRSFGVTRWLRQQGFQRVQSIAGGIDAWSVEVDPTLPRY